jgi:glycosyltransferase involved in cell wall biosynthesis
MNAVLLAILILLLLILVLSVMSGFMESYQDKSLSVFQFFLKNMDREVDPVTMRYFSKFNEATIEKELRNYANQCRIGKNYIQEKSVVVAGLIRNAEDNIGFLRSFYEDVKRSSKKTAFVIVENNSTDTTRERLLEWHAEDPTITVLCDADKPPNEPVCRLDGHEHFYQDKSPSTNRIQKLAYLRNIYIDYIKKTPELVGHDFLIVMDLDLQGRLFMDGIYHSFYHFEKEPDTSAIACNGTIRDANNRYVYYDSFAFAEIGDPIEWNTTFDKSSHDQDVLLYTTERYSRDMSLHKVASAFGGMCIYRMSELCQKKSRYSYSQDSRLSCEHVYFNKGFRNFYVNPKMIFLIDRNP